MSKDLISLLIITLITTFAWIGFEVYRAATKPQLPNVKKELLRPIDPELNQKALEIIRSSQGVSNIGNQESSDR